MQSFKETPNRATSIFCLLWSAGSHLGSEGWVVDGMATPTHRAAPASPHTDPHWVGDCGLKPRLGAATGGRRPDRVALWV